LIKKATELAILADAEVGLLIFSPAGKLSIYSSKPIEGLLTKLKDYSGSPEVARPRRPNYRPRRSRPSGATQVHTNADYFYERRRKEGSLQLELADGDDDEDWQDAGLGGGRSADAPSSSHMAVPSQVTDAAAAAAAALGAVVPNGSDPYSLASAGAIGAPGVAYMHRGSSSQMVPPQMGGIVPGMPACMPYVASMPQMMHMPMPPTPPFVHMGAMLPDHMMMQQHPQLMVPGQSILAPPSGDHPVAAFQQSALQQQGQGQPQQHEQQETGQAATATVHAPAPSAPSQRQVQASSLPPTSRAASAAASHTKKPHVEFKRPLARSDADAGQPTRKSRNHKNLNISAPQAPPTASNPSSVPPTPPPAHSPAPPPRSACRLARTACC
jgi:hypothetical protein